MSKFLNKLRGDSNTAYTAEMVNQLTLFEGFKKQTDHLIQTITATISV